MDSRLLNSIYANQMPLGGLTVAGCEGRKAWRVCDTCGRGAAELCVKTKRDGRGEAMHCLCQTRGVLRVEEVRI
jgi:hypothetical protein